jgi:hypothetical protein
MISNKLYYTYNFGIPIKDIATNYDDIIDFLYTKTQLFISQHNPSIKIDRHDSPITYKQHPGYVYFLTYTKPGVNHPYMTYSNVYTPYITIMIPIGGDYGQCGFKDIYNILDTEQNFTDADYLGLYVLLQKTIIIRKDNILVQDRYSVLKCENMTNCKKKIAALNNDPEFNYNINVLSREIEFYKQYYRDKGIRLLTTYFNALEAGYFKDAYDFLKGGTKSSNYFGRERLNTFFKDTSVIIGHLQIFIPLYELLLEVGSKF